MRAWFLMLGGLAIWAAHFTVVYGIASAADLSPDQAVMFRSVGGVFSLVCLAGLAAIFLAAQAWRSVPHASGRLVFTVARVGSVLAAIAVTWQSLPLVVSV